MRWPSSDHALAEPIQARRMSTAAIACFILPSLPKDALSTRWPPTDEEASRSEALSEEPGKRAQKLARSQRLPCAGRRCGLGADGVFQGMRASVMRRMDGCGHPRGRRTPPCTRRSFKPCAWPAAGSGRSYLPSRRWWRSASYSATAEGWTMCSSASDRPAPGRCDPWPA